MTDPKKNPNKQRRSFFWRRKPDCRFEQAEGQQASQNRCRVRPGSGIAQLYSRVQQLHSVSSQSCRRMPMDNLALTPRQFSRRSPKCSL